MSCVIIYGVGFVFRTSRSWAIKISKGMSVVGGIELGEVKKVMD